jgi:hypothetical protein
MPDPQPSVRATRSGRPASICGGLRSSDPAPARRQGQGRGVPIIEIEIEIPEELIDLGDVDESEGDDIGAELPVPNNTSLNVNPILAPPPAHSYNSQNTGAKSRGDTGDTDHFFTVMEWDKTPRCLVCNLCL